MQIRVKGLQQLQTLEAKLNGSARELTSSMREIHDAWAQLYSANMLRRFHALSGGGAWDGDSWKPLAASTKMGRRDVRKGSARIASGRRRVTRAREALHKAQVSARRQLKKLERKQGVSSTYKELSRRLIQLRIKKVLKRVNAAEGSLSQSTTKRSVTMTKIRILRDTGMLMAGLTRGGNGWLERSAGTKLEVGLGGGSHTEGLTIGQLAAIHHHGAPERNLPARPIIVQPDARTRERMGRALVSGVQKWLRTQ